MKIENKRVTGNVVVKKNTQFNNIDAVTVTVEEGIIARLYGVVNKNILIKNGATVYLHGKFFGKVVNEGGVLYVFGPSGEILTY